MGARLNRFPAQRCSFQSRRIRADYI
jgi:hypothetical protein